VGLSKCELCGEEVKNIGLHKYHKHRVAVGTGPAAPQELSIDVPSEKPLSELVENMKSLLRPYRFSIKVSYEEEDVDKKFLEITARIQYRR